MLVGREGNVGVREESRLCLESLWGPPPHRGTVQGRLKPRGTLGLDSG